MDTAVTTPTTREPGSGRLVAASLVGILALLLLAVGGAGLWVRASSDHGYTSSGAHPYQTGGRAIVSDAMDVDEFPSWLVAKLRVKATSDKPLFVGVAQQKDVDRYLAGVGHSTVEDVSFGPFEVDYSSQAGVKTPSRPGQQTFWLDSSTGAGEQSVAWKVREGSYRFVVMNADGSAGVHADAKVGASLHGTLVAVLAALAAGLALLGVAVTLIVRGR
jgi:hypothetical protein